MTAPAPRAYVVVLNWNGWRDTIDCLESLERIDYDDVRVVVCDNGSTDDSLARIGAWIAARDAGAGAPLSRGAAERTPPTLRRFSLVANDANLGFAGGTNVGVRHALNDPDARYVWLLNNDTVVDRGALRALVARLAERPRAGQCGSRLVYHDGGDVVQAYGGGRYNHWLGTTRPLGAGAPAGAPVDADAVERLLQYVSAASVLVRREMLEQVGLFAEDYFLYNEEVDFAERARGRFASAYAHDSVVLHKEGRSTGANRSGRRKGALADFYSLRSRLLVARRHRPWALPVVYASVAGAAINRLRRGQPDRVWMIARLLLGPRSASPPRRVG